MVLLKLGSVGNQVRQLQEMLNFLVPTPPPLKADGIFGPATKARVTQFQKITGLSSDGVVGPLTGKALIAGVLAATLFRAVGSPH
jgi:peptidoglycan hydrolase-like protein with peptidoglycan-binding domain